jgi:hypothetical protein
MAASGDEVDTLKGPGERYWPPERGPFDNDGSIGSGMAVPLHWTRPLMAWSTRRLPLRPLPVGFAVTSILGAGGVLGLITLWRFHRRGSNRHGGCWRTLGVIVALAVVLNLLAAGLLWAWWHSGSRALDLRKQELGHNEYQLPNAIGLPAYLGHWPAWVLADWPRRPTWIGWTGEAPGVRAYQLTTGGVPSAARMWFHTTWGPGAFDPHQSMNVVQVGWPLPCFQSEERITVAGRTAEGDLQEKQGGTSWMIPHQPIERTSGQWSATLRGGPAPAIPSSPLPFVPLRPLWLPLGINMTLYLAVAAVIVLAPGAIRTLVRLRKGRCLSCGYDVRELVVCPECGGACEGSTILLRDSAQCQSGCPNPGADVR